MCCDIFDNLGKFKSRLDSRDEEFIFIKSNQKNEISLKKYYFENNWVFSQI